MTIIYFVNCDCANCTSCTTLHIFSLRFVYSFVCATAEMTLGSAQLVGQVRALMGKFIC